MYRVYKLSWSSGLALSLPILLGVAWYAWSAYAALDRYLRASDGSVPLSRELFQIGLHDELDRDLWRMSLQPRPEKSSLPTYELYLPRASVDALNAHAIAETEESYVKGVLEKGTQVHEVAVRYRGAAHWNRLGPQKSLKLRLAQGDLLDDTRVFNLLNDPTPLGLEQQIILDIAREHGLLAPEYHPVRLRLNNSDMGVYRYEAQPDEGLLRRSGRMPGNLYSGDSPALDPARGVGALFYDRAGWTKVAWKTDATKADYGELERLLAAIGSGTGRAFAEYAAQSLALDKYALFDALDVVFGGNDHDYQSNHKLYVDPYTGRLEPVAWSYREFHHEPVFNLVENPLLLRLLLTPGYLAQRDRAVYELLTGPAAVSAVRARADQAFEVLRPELESDPYWDAYKLLPRASRFTRFMLRPMNTARWLLAARDEFDDFAQRSRFLLDELEAEGLRVSFQAARLDLDLRGHVAYRLAQIAPGAPHCSGRFSLYADVDRDGRLSPQDVEVAGGEIGAQSRLSRYAELWPGVTLEALARAKPEIGKVRSVPVLRRYSYFVRSPDCVPETLAVVLESLVTGRSQRIDLSRALPSSGLAPSGVPTTGDPEGIPRLEPGDTSPHPWDLPGPAPAETIELGPGLVSINHSLRLGPQQTLRVRPGTRLALGPEVSLILFGPSFFEGTPSRPIVIERARRSSAFGGVALQGPGSAGSRWSNVELRGGTHPEHPGIDFPGMLDVHASHDIVLESCRLLGAAADDALHVNSVDRLGLYELEIEGSERDALDLEFVHAEVRGLRVRAAGDDCVDLMSSELTLSDSLLMGCTHNAISAGERTVLGVHNSLIAASHTGVLAKNASHVRLLRSVIYRAQLALHTARHEIRYQGQSGISAEELFVVDSDVLRREARGSPIELGRVQTSLPLTGDLPRLADVLQLNGWASLGDNLAALDSAPVSP